MSTTSLSDGKHIRTKVIDQVLVATLDSPNVKVNSLGDEIMHEFKHLLQDMETNSSYNSVVLISGKPGCFVAGADVNMLETFTTVDHGVQKSKAGQELCNKLESSRKPVVAAINGACLGGGLEIALASHYRIATKDSKTVLGLPEVMLGLLPGSGGTQRLPKLTSVPTALDMQLTGRNIKADKAKKLGLVDLLIDTLGPGLDTPQNNTMALLEKVAIQTAKDLASGKIKVFIYFLF